MKKISQVEARQLRRRVEELETQRDRLFARWTRDYPGGTHIATLTVPDVTVATIGTARKLDHAVICSQDGNALYFYALPQAAP